MTCADVRDLIEAVAAGDEPPSPAFEAHVGACSACAAALESARRVERALAAFAAPPAPPQFSRNVLAAIRRARWQYDNRVDRAFNLAILAGVAIVAVAAVSLLNLSSVSRVLLAGIEALADARNQPAPWTRDSSVPIALTTMMFATAFGIWWWAERRSEPREERAQ